ncbi:MAG TPA: RluA family pseudouridine synthase [Vicinamibacterales bacterium]|nr:RluA family pseudouridine synthase [Vicinamibacterales bacterium]
MADRWVVEPGDGGLRLDKFLAAAGRLGSRGRAAEALERGKIYVNEQEAGPVDAARRLAPGDAVRLWMDRPGSSRKRIPRAPRPGELPIIFEDEALIVVNKPAGLLTVPLPRRDEAPSVEEALAGHLRSKGRRRPCVVHRIDRDTSGLVLFATRPDAQSRLKDQFRRHEAERIYLAVVYGVPSPAEGIWQDHLAWDQDSLIQKETHARDPRASEASCRYEVLEDFGDAALIQVRLITGRRNQIRLQARLRGHTLIGEQRYTYGPQAIRNMEFPRQALHAWRLGIEHPITGRPMRFEAPVPADIEDLIAELMR